MVVTSVVDNVGFSRLEAQGSGNNRAISRSNRRNKIATRKNRSENGSRALPRGSNPHSYGDSFSRSGYSWGNQKLIRISSNETISEKISIVVKFIVLS